MMTGKSMVHTETGRSSSLQQLRKSSLQTDCRMQKEEMDHASRSSNKAAVPEAKGALDKFKYEVATELGVPLTDGYNGDLTSKQNGSVGGYMVKK